MTAFWYETEKTTFTVYVRDKISGLISIM